MPAIIADHETSDRDTLVDLCHSHGGLGDLFVVRSGADAIAQIRVSQPAVALLACELTDMTGFDVLRALQPDERPAAIMIAEDDRHVAEALSSSATDYLTRPVSANRLAVALKKACRSTGRLMPPARVPKASWGGTDPRCASALLLRHGDRLVGERAGRLYFFSPAEIDYIQADSNYVRLHVGAERYINRDSLTRLSALLESIGFVRISRAVLLNMERVCFAEREGRGVLAFVLESGVRVVSSTGFRLESGALLRITRSRGIRRRRQSA